MSDSDTCSSGSGIPFTCQYNLVLADIMADQSNISCHFYQMFVELDELYLGENNEFEWQEKARWIKFEEDVEEGVDRWGKPHVASLSFHSLLELRKCIEQGVYLRK